MATVSQPNTNVTFGKEIHPHTHAKVRLWAVPLGRFLYSLMFVLSGFNHFSQGTIDYATGMGVPMANFLVPLSGLMILVGGLSIILGYKARFGALLLILFLVPVTFKMHAFWTIEDAAMAQMQMINFMKNISLLGAAILFAFYGAGPVSIDNYRAKLYH